METLQNQKIVIAGGSGFLGLSMAQAFHDAGAQVVILSRSKPKFNSQTTSGLQAFGHCEWDGRTTGDWCDALHQADALVNLAGRTVNCIKTPDHRDEILRSRVESTLTLGKAMRSIPRPPKVWVQMSTAHIYGDPPKAICNEESPFGLGLAPDVARAWESAFEESRLPNQRGVVMRTSFVIGRNRGAGGGALGTLGALTRFGLGGKVASGTQGMSWIHEEDLNRLFANAISDPSMSGAYIISSPQPVSQTEFMRTLRKVMGVPIGLPSFGWMVRLAAPLLLRTDPELVLYGRYVVSKRLEEMGFSFRHPDLESALRDLYS